MNNQTKGTSEKISMLHLDELGVWRTKRLTIAGELAQMCEPETLRQEMLAAVEQAEGKE